ncbi:MAG: TlyA family RNA methyltransferase [Polyangiaceae bacterium]|nr:TlyA family RNA methyltransferase [Polyangiaceae bacterium]
MSEPRVRLDVLLVERGLAETRQKAQALVVAGHVFQGERRLDKPGAPVARDVELTVRGRDNPYVSRGGLKLRGALLAFAPRGLEVTARVALDVGASTGGFTDCLLQHGARKVYAVDVGKGLLHDKLRRDPRVVVREGENARFLSAASFDEPVDVAVIDASFIGLAALLPPVAASLRPGGALCALVKPQFEAGRDAVARGRGVIRDEAVRDAAIARVRDALGEHGLSLVAETDAAVRGPKGNLERFVYARRAS